MFTSGSLRFAAYAGWYSALGDEKLMNQWSHQAHGEWVKEVSGGRNFGFLGCYNSDMYWKISPEKMKELVDEFLKKIKNEIRKGKGKDMVERI